jgi:Protein of unknown function (DUF1761)
MAGVNYWAILVAAVAAFAMSSIYYMVFGKARMRLLGNDPDAGADMRKVPVWKMPVEFVRGLVVAVVMAHLVVQSRVADVTGALELGLWLAIGFPVMILSGSVLWDRRPWQLAAIHAGDWLLKILLMVVIFGAWPQKS